MKSFKSLHLGSPEVASNIAYDPHAHSLLVSGPKFAIVSDHSKEEIQLAKSQEPLPAKGELAPREPPFLRFSAAGQSQLMVSHSGTNYLS